MMRKSRVILLAICMIAGLLFIAKNLGQLAHTPTKFDFSHALAQNIMSPKDLASLVNLKSCPVCFGQDMCRELAREDLEIRNVHFKPDELLPEVVQVYKGLDVKYWIRPITSGGRLQSSLTGLDQSICRNASVQGSCEPGLGADNSFLYSMVLNDMSIRSLYKTHLASRDLIPMTACPTYKLVDGLVQAFDENSDKTLTAQEKASLITSLTTNPDVVVYKLIQNQQIHIPQLTFYGSCGRITLVEGEFRPLGRFLDHSWELRKGLASQILGLIDVFLNEDPNWVLFMSEITLDNLVVTKSGQLVFLDFSRLMIIDRDFLDEDFKDVKKVCNFDCLSSFYKALVTSEETTPCYQVRPFLEYMYALVCRNILSDAQVDRSSRPKRDQRGLLHTIKNTKESHVIEKLIRECVDETQKGGRIEAFMNLQELMLANADEEPVEDEHEDHRDDQGDYEEGNVAHADDVVDEENLDNIIHEGLQEENVAQAEDKIKEENQDGVVQDGLKEEPEDPANTQYTPPPDQINIA